MKYCVIESDYGIKLSPGRIVNPGIPMYLNEREIFNLLKRTKVRVYEIVNGEKVLLTLVNYNKVNIVEVPKVNEVNIPSVKVEEPVEEPAKNEETTSELTNDEDQTSEDEQEVSEDDNNESSNVEEQDETVAPKVEKTKNQNKNKNNYNYKKRNK